MAETRLKITPREMEVLRLVLEWKSKAEVADELYISERAVDYHLAQILAKIVPLVGHGRL